MAVTVVNLGTLIAKDAKDSWELALPMLEEVLGRTPWGLGFGWTVSIIKPHRHKVNGASASLQFREVDLLRRLCVIRLRPLSSVHWFDVGVSWTRKDVPTPVVTAAIQKACGPTAITDDHHAQLPPPGPANGVHPLPPPVDLEAKLGKMKTGIERLLEMARDQKAGEVLKAEAVKRHAAAMSAKEGPEARYEQAKRRCEVLAEEWQALSKQAAELESKLARTRNELEAVGAQRQEAATDFMSADAAFAPLLLEFQEALANLQSMEAAERERAAAMSQAGDLAPLLAALERLA